MAAASIVVASIEALLGVAGPVVGAHRDGEELARGPALGGADPLRVGDGDGLRVRGERAEGGDAGRVRRSDHRACPVGPQLRAGVRRPVGPGGLQWLGGLRLGQARPALQLLDVGRDGGGPFDQRPDALRIRATGGGDGHATPPDEPEVDEDLGAGDVLVDLAVGEPGERRLAAHDERLRLRGARRLGQPDDLLREAERGGRVAADPVPPAHATTPTRTLRNRAPRDAVAHVAGLAGFALAAVRRAPHPPRADASPTASIERHSS